MTTAYRLVTNLHLMCSETVETLRKIGKTRRATRDIRDAVDNERMKKSAEKLQSIERDLAVLREENAAMREKLKEAASKAKM